MRFLAFLAMAFLVFGCDGQKPSLDNTNQSKPYNTNQSKPSRETIFDFCESAALDPEADYESRSALAKRFGVNDDDAGRMAMAASQANVDVARQALNNSIYGSNSDNSFEKICRARVRERLYP